LRGFESLLGRWKKPEDIKTNLTPERIAKQLQILRDHLPNAADVTFDILQSLKQTTTKAAKKVEDQWADLLKSPQKTTDRKKVKAMKAEQNNGAADQ
jgi:hypothetical protein